MWTEPTELRIRVKPFKSKAFDVAVDPIKRVEDLRRTIIAERPELDSEHLKILYAGRILANDRRVKDYDIKPGIVVVAMVVKIPARQQEPAAQPQTAAVAAEESGSSASASSPGRPVEVGAALSEGRARQAAAHVAQQAVAFNGEMGALLLIAWRRHGSMLADIRRSLIQDPHAYPQIIEEMTQFHPGLVQAFAENSESFLRMLQVLDLDAANMASQTVLSAEEQACVDRLQALGFDRATAIEAFLMHARNEDHAAESLIFHLVSEE